jgi:hypothetical protein
LPPPSRRTNRMNWVSSANLEIPLKYPSTRSLNSADPAECDGARPQTVRSFLKRSESMCSMSERFSYRQDRLVNESRSNPYIGFFLRHTKRSEDSKPRRSRRGSARFCKPPVLKSVIPTGSSTPSEVSPNGPKKKVQFNEVVRHASVIIDRTGDHNREDGNEGNLINVNILNFLQFSKFK